MSEPTGFEIYPMEDHGFVGEHNKFLCRDCGRPRAMHYRYPFHPAADNPEWFRPPYVRYKGPHPAFTRPGSRFKKDRNDEPLKISPQQRAYAERIRAAERLAAERYAKDYQSRHTLSEQSFTT